MVFFKGVLVFAIAIKQNRSKKMKMKLKQNRTSFIKGSRNKRGNKTMREAVKHPVMKVF